MLSNIGLEPLSERQQFPNVKGDEKSINELIQDGSEFEDDGFRSRGHFFNPLNGYALFNVSGFVPSPDWTLEDTGDISGQNDSFKDTRQFFFEALTLSSETDRKMKWGRTFQGLGQVIHHLQDMAQPEHSRVDPHLVYTPEGFPSGLLPGEDPSRYEHYSAEKSNICDPPISPPALPTLPTPCFSYAPVHFQTARQFWLTKENGPDRGTGAGIAEFTNNNFVTKDTNFINLSPPEAVLPLFTTQNGYPLPNSAGASVVVNEFSELQLPPIASFPPSPLAGKLYFIGTPVYDQYTQQTGFNPRTSTYSIYDADLKSHGVTYDCNPNNDPNYDPNRVCRSSALFTLNTFNFDYAHQFLIKRAIGYSAGLINYFFRGVGKLTVAQNATVSYQSEVTNQSTEPMSGTFSLYYETNEGDVYLPENVTFHLATSWSGTLGPGETMAVPSFSSPESTFRYTLVFQGTMGQESHTAIATGANPATGNNLVYIPCPPANCVPPPPPPYDCGPYGCE